MIEMLRDLIGYFGDEDEHVLDRFGFFIVCSVIIFLLSMILTSLFIVTNGWIVVAFALLWIVFLGVRRIGNLINEE